MAWARFSVGRGWRRWRREGYKHPRHSRRERWRMRARPGGARPLFSRQPLPPRSLGAGRRGARPSPLSLRRWCGRCGRWGLHGAGGGRPWATRRPLERGLLGDEWGWAENRSVLKAILGLFKNELRGLGFSRDLVTEAGSLFSASGQRLTSVNLVRGRGEPGSYPDDAGKRRHQKGPPPLKDRGAGVWICDPFWDRETPPLTPALAHRRSPSFPCAKSFQRQWEMIVCSEFFPPIHFTKLKHLMTTFLLKTICYFKASEWMILYLFFLRILACFSLF